MHFDVLDALLAALSLLVASALITPLFAARRQFAGWLNFFFCLAASVASGRHECRRSEWPRAERGAGRARGIARLSVPDRRVFCALPGDDRPDGLADGALLHRLPRDGALPPIQPARVLRELPALSGRHGRHRHGGRPEQRFHHRLADDDGGLVLPDPLRPPRPQGRSQREQVPAADGAGLAGHRRCRADASPQHPRRASARADRRPRHRRRNPSRAGLRSPVARLRDEGGHVPARTALAAGRPLVRALADQRAAVRRDDQDRRLRPRPHAVLDGAAGRAGARARAIWA